MERHPADSEDRAKPGSQPCSDSNNGLSWGSAKATVQAAQVALAALPGSGGTIFLAGQVSSGAIILGSAAKHVTLRLSQGAQLTMTDTLTWTSGSSIVGEGPNSSPVAPVPPNAPFVSQAEIQCETPGKVCIQGTDDYASEAFLDYQGGSRLENLRIECGGGLGSDPVGKETLACENGLNMRGAGIGTILRNVTINGATSDCLVIKDSSSYDWTESFSAEDVFLTSCGVDGVPANGVTVDVSAGGFFNDGHWTNLQVRTTNGHFVQMNSGSGVNGDGAIARQTFISMHGLSGSGVWFQNGGGAITGIAFITPELEGTSSTGGYPIDGNLSSDSATHVSVVGLGWYKFQAGMLSPNVSFDIFTSSNTGDLGGLVTAGSCVAMANSGNYSCTHYFANPYPSIPVCVANSSVSPANVWVVENEAYVTLYANYQGAQINWTCHPLAN